MLFWIFNAIIFNRVTTFFDLECPFSMLLSQLQLHFCQFLLKMCRFDMKICMWFRSFYLIIFMWQNYGRSRLRISICRVCVRDSGYACFFCFFFCRILLKFCRFSCYGMKMRMYFGFLICPFLTELRPF